jgi:hypothetical protein
LRHVEGKESLLVQLYLKGSKEITSIHKRTLDIKDASNGVKWTDENKIAMEVVQ